MTARTRGTRASTRQQTEQQVEDTQSQSASASASASMPTSTRPSRQAKMPKEVPAPAPAQTPVPVSAVPLDQPEFQKQLSDTRQMWEFVLLFQFIAFFYPWLQFTSTDLFDVDILEEELMGLTTEYDTLNKVRFGLIKQLLDHKQRTNDFDRDVEKVYKSRIPRGHGCDIENPLTELEDGFACDWHSMSVADKVRILAQLCRWVSTDHKFIEKFEKYRENQEGFDDHDYRIQPIAYEGEFISYYLFDDNRLYKKTEFGPDLSDQRDNLAAAKTQKKKKPNRRASRVVKTPDDENEDEGVAPLKEALAREYIPDWELLCDSVESFRALIDQLKQPANKKRKRDAKTQEGLTGLADYLQEIMPSIEKYYKQDRPKTALSRVKARNKVEAVVHRKRSSRLETKRAEQEQEDYERRQQELEQEKLDMANLSKRQIKQLEKERRNRFKERIKAEKQKQAKVEKGTASRRSTRNAAKGEEGWMFDCSCGIWGENYEDDEPAIQCDECKTWLHQACEAKAKAPSPAPALAKTPAKDDGVDCAIDATNSEVKTEQTAEDGGPAVDANVDETMTDLSSADNFTCSMCIDEAKRAEQERLRLIEKERLMEEQRKLDEQKRLEHERLKQERKEQRKRERQEKKRLEKEQKDREKEQERQATNNVKHPGFANHMTASPLYAASKQSSSLYSTSSQQQQQQPQQSPLVPPHGAVRQVAQPAWPVTQVQNATPPIYSQPSVYPTPHPSQIPAPPPPPPSAAPGNMGYPHTMGYSHTPGSGYSADHANQRGYSPAGPPPVVQGATPTTSAPSVHPPLSALSATDQPQSTPAPNTGTSHTSPQTTSSPLPSINNLLNAASTQPPSSHTNENSQQGQGEQSKSST